VQLVPFPNTHALFARITDVRFGDATATDPFVPIPAVCHWLYSQWDEGHLDLSHSLELNETDSNIANHYLDAYAKGVEEWKQAFSARDDVARATLNIYYVCWQGGAHRGFPATEVEPLSWCSDVQRGAKSMMNAYGLLKLGVAGFPQGSIQPYPGEVSHAASVDGLRTTLLWGGNRFQPNVLTTQYLAARKERGATDLLCGKCLLVLLQPLGRMSFENLSKRFNAEDTDITKGVADDALGFVKQGDVVSAAPPEIKWIYADDLIGQVSQAGNPTELESRLADVIRSAVA
jgi:hypothetical protein